MRLSFALLIWAGLLSGGFLCSGILTEDSAFAGEFKVPSLVGPVQDEAGLFGEETKQRISALLMGIHQQGGPQIQILTIESLGGVPIESAAIDIVDSWKLGSEKKDDGVLLLISKADHKIRLEVGQGLEGELPDVVAKRIISRVITPYFKAGQWNRGLTEGVVAVVGYIYPQALDKSELVQDEASDPPVRTSQGMKNFFFILIFLLIGLLRLFLGGGRYSSRYYGGGGSSGGGWSGGGGGFSGGGASGDW